MNKNNPLKSFLASKNPQKQAKQNDPQKTKTKTKQKTKKKVKRKTNQNIQRKNIKKTFFDIIEQYSRF